MLFHPTSEQNKFGFYRVGPTFCTYSLFEAVEHRQKTNYTIKWDYNNDFFQAIDWKKEPTKSLRELYGQRCKQLRDKYDYLVLWFSGGSDSHNILSSFIEYGIHLDEVLTYHTEKISGVDKTSKVDFMGEIFLAAIPEAQRLLNQSPHTKHRVIDISDQVEKTMTDLATSALKFDFLYFGNSYTNPTVIAGKQLVNLPCYQDLYRKGKRVCFISGIEKPYVEFLDRRWQFKFFNRVDSMFDISRQIENNNYIFDELFYWAPDAWEIPIKQCHEIRRFFRTNPEFIEKTVKQSLPTIDGDYESGLYLLGKSVPGSLIEKIIYPYWREDIVDFGKQNRSTLIGWRNDWFTNRPLSMTPGAQQHIAGIKKFSELLGFSGDVQYCHDHIFYSDPYYF